ncbi:hypothetical protein AYI68_g6950, partial [Smittium mucronatum]
MNGLDVASDSLSHVGGLDEMALLALGNCKSQRPHDHLVRKEQVR